jgi:hypothetical protein
LVFITEMKSVYSAVRTGSLNKAVCASSLKGSNTFKNDSGDASRLEVGYGAGCSSDWN